MPLIVAAGSALDADPYELAEAAAAAGFDGFGLRLSDHHQLSDPVDFRRYAAGLGLTLHDAEVIRVGSALDPGPLLEQAAAAGAAAVLVVSDTGVRRTTIDGVADIVAIAEPLGLVVGLEVHGVDRSDDAGRSRGGRRADRLRGRGRRVAPRACGGRPTRARDGPRIGGFRVAAALPDAVRTAPPEGELVSEARHHRLLPGHGSLPLADLLAAFGPTAGRSALEHVVSVEVQSDELMAEVAVGDRFRLLHDAARSVLAAGAASGRARSGSEQHRVATEVRAGGRRVHLRRIVGIRSHVSIEHACTAIGTRPNRCSSTGWVPS